MKPSHGTIETLDYFDGHALLKSRQFGHLACHDKDDIYLVPITYIYDDGYLYCHSRPGKKVDMMRRNPEICIQVEEIEDFFHWKSVIAWGRFEELEGENAVRAMRLLIKSFRDKDHADKISELELDMEAELDSRVMFRMKVEKTTARYEDADPNHSNMKPEAASLNLS